MIDRIKQVLDYSQLSSSAFADAIGISRSGMAHLLNGRNQPSLDVARKILATYPEISTEWLIMGMGEMMRTDDLTPQGSTPENRAMSQLDENSKIGGQIDMFGEFENSDEPEEDMEGENIDTPDSDVEETTEDEDVVSENEDMEAVSTPAVTPVTPSRSQNAPSRSRKSSADNRPSAVRRHTAAAPQTKKIQKIIFFYDDHSFEIYS